MISFYLLPESRTEAMRRNYVADSIGESNDLRILL